MTDRRRETVTFTKAGQRGFRAKQRPFVQLKTTLFDEVSGPAEGTVWLDRDFPKEALTVDEVGYDGDDRVVYRCGLPRTHLKVKDFVSQVLDGRLILIGLRMGHRPMSIVHGDD